MSASVLFCMCVDFVCMFVFFFVSECVHARRRMPSRRGQGGAAVGFLSYGARASRIIITIQTIIITQIIFSLNPYDASFPFFFF